METLHGNSIIPLCFFVQTFLPLVLWYVVDVIFYNCQYHSIIQKMNLTMGVVNLIVALFYKKILRYVFLFKLVLCSAILYISYFTIDVILYHTLKWHYFTF